MSTTPPPRDPQAGPAARALPRKLLASRWTWLAAGLVTAYAGFSYLAVDPLARWLLPRVAQNNLGSQAQVQRVAFDPWRLKLTAEGLKLSRPDGALLAGFERLVVDFEASSLLQWAWHFQAVELSGAQVHLDVAPDGRFNWADLLAALDKGKAADTPPSTTLPRVKVDRLHIDNSTIDYQQRDPASPFRATLQPLGLDLEGLSTLPNDRGQHLLQARLPDQGGTLKWSGDIALNPLASSGKIEVEGIKLARLMDIVRGQDLPVGGVEGEAATSLNYRFALVRGQAQAYPQLQIDGMTVTLDRLAADLRASGKAQARVQAQQAQVRVPQVLLSLQDKPQVVVTGMAVSLRELGLVREQRPLFGLAQAQVEGIGFDSAARRLQVKNVLLQQGQVNTRRDPAGQLDWLALAEALTPPAKPQAAPKANAQPPAQATAAATPPLGFAVERVRLERWQAAHQDLAFVRPLAVAAKDITLEFAVNDTGAGAVVPSLQADIAGLAVTSAGTPQPLASLARVSLRGGSADAGKRTARVDSVTLAGLRTHVLQPAGGAPLNWLAALEARPMAGAKAASAPKAAPASAQAPAWSAALGRLALEDATVHVEDRTPATPVVLDLRGASAEMRDLSLDLAKPVPLRVRLPIAQGGVIEANGRLAPQPLRADLQLRVDRVALRPMGPYLNQVALLKLDGGEANLRGRLNVDAGKALKGSFRGSAGVRQLAISEEIGGASFLAWQEVSSDSLNLDLAPPRLAMGTLRVVRPVGKFIIHEDGTLNATRLLRQAPAAPVTAATAASAARGASTPTATAAKPAPGPAAAASAPAPAADAFAVAIDRVSVDNASLEFADLTLRPQFGTHIDALSGVINGLSSDPRTTAQVELDGKVDEFGSARVRGTVQPFRATESTDLKLAFRNLEMAHLTPYSGKFAGRRIDSGKLSVDLEYKIQQRQLAGQNKFVIQQLKLGERVDSPEAVNLPLDLAIAILQDSDGVIDLDLPISGSLDDPQFSYGRIIWKAITNVLTRIVTAPFRALGSLLGADADKMQAIVFDAGSATLAPQEQEKLGAVTRALSKRPGLRLAIVPTFDTARDTIALQEQAMRRAVLEDAGVKLQPGERPGPLDLYNTKVQSAIERQLKARTTGGLNLKLLDNLKDAVRSAKPEDIPRYTQMLEQLRPTFPVTQAQLAELATARAAAVRNELVQTAKLAPERVELAAPVAKAGSDQGVALQLELRAAAVAAAAAR